MFQNKHPLLSPSAPIRSTYRFVLTGGRTVPVTSQPRSFNVTVTSHTSTWRCGASAYVRLEGDPVSSYANRIAFHSHFPPKFSPIGRSLFVAGKWGVFQSDNGAGPRLEQRTRQQRRKLYIIHFSICFH